MYRFLRPLLFRLDAERAHHLATTAAQLAQSLGSPLIAPLFAHRDSKLVQSLWELEFANPVGLAAGFDKNATLMRFWQELGFGFVEVGSVSSRPSRGNPRPRAFRLPADRALINRMGLNNDGADRIAPRLERARRQLGVPVGINIAKTHDPTIVEDAAIRDFCESFRVMCGLGDYIVLNISCPNTREGKTFEEPRALEALLAAIMAEREALRSAVPVLIKLGPPADEVGAQTAELVDIATAHRVHGFVATNTASDRHGLASDTTTIARAGAGGLSGAPLADRSTRLIRFLYRQTGGTVPIIGVGGVASAEAAYEKLRAGASLVQLYTALVYEGPGVVGRINRGLVELLERDGFSSIAEATGVDC